MWPVEVVTRTWHVEARRRPTSTRSVSFCTRSSDDVGRLATRGFHRPVCITTPSPSVEDPRLCRLRGSAFTGWYTAALTRSRYKNLDCVDLMMFRFHSSDMFPLFHHQYDECEPSSWPTSRFFRLGSLTSYCRHYFCYYFRLSDAAHRFVLFSYARVL